MRIEDIDSTLLDEAKATAPGNPLTPLINTEPIVSTIDKITPSVTIEIDGKKRTTVFTTKYQPMKSSEAASI